MKTLLLIPFLFLAACASNPNRAERIDTKIEYAEKAGADVTIGVRGGEMIAQRQVLISEELRRAQNDSYELEANVYGGQRYLDNYGLWGALRNCNIRLAHRTGEIKPMGEKRAYVIPEEDYQMGLDKNNQIIGLQREYLKERLERFHRYKEVLLERKQEYEDKIALCELAMRQKPQSVAGVSDESH